MDEEHHELPPEVRGEICIRGAANMIGYLNKPEATSETILDGWLHTGDIGYRDEEGFFYIVDRKKDMINRGGENIYPREVEMAIEGLDGVVAVAVIGVPDEALGERVKAYIVPSAPEAIDADQVTAYLQDKLARYKIPEFIEIRDDLPRSQTGKILKRELRAGED